MSSKSPKKSTKTHVESDKFSVLLAKFKDAKNKGRNVDITHLKSDDWSGSRLLRETTIYDDKVKVPGFTNVFTSSLYPAQRLLEKMRESNETWNNSGIISELHDNFEYIASRKRAPSARGRPRKNTSSRDASPRSSQKLKGPTRRSKKDQEIADLFANGYKKDQVVEILSSRNANSRKFESNAGHIHFEELSPRSSPRASLRTSPRASSTFTSPTSPRTSPRASSSFASPRTSPRASSYFTAASSPRASSPRFR